jgi:hypothetical protein
MPKSGKSTHKAPPDKSLISSYFHCRLGDPSKDEAICLRSKYFIIIIPLGFQMSMLNPGFLSPSV